MGKTYKKITSLPAIFLSVLLVIAGLVGYGYCGYHWALLLAAPFIIIAGLVFIVEFLGA